MDVTLSFGFHAPPWLTLALLAMLAGVARTVFRSRHKLASRSSRPLVSPAVPRGSDRTLTRPQRFGHSTDLR